MVDDLEVAPEGRVLIRHRVEAMRAVRDDFPDALVVQDLNERLRLLLVQILVAEAPGVKAPSIVRHKTSPRCSDLLARASLGEPLTDKEQTFLTRDCR